MINEVKERMRLFPAIDKDGYKRLERLIDLNKGKLSEIEQARLKASASSGGSGGSGSGGKGNKDDDTPQYTYENSQTTTNWKNLLPTMDEFRRYDGGYEYNGKKYTDFNEMVSDKLYDSLENGELTEDQAYSIASDLGILW